MNAGELREALRDVSDEIPVCVRACGEDYDYENATIARSWVIEWVEDDSEDGDPVDRPCFVVE